MMNNVHDFKMQAAADFTRARGKALFSQIYHIINTDKDKLLSFNDVKDILKPKNQTYKGMQIVPVNLIVGSEGRYRDFNKFFLPRAEHLRSRWERVDEASLKDITLPPIQLYEIGGVYFVRDGNHRVSVARTQNVENIDAEVISLSSKIPIKPGMTTEELKNALIEKEKQMFYEETNYGTLTGDNDLRFTTPGCYDVIYNHILVHKYYLNQNRQEEIPFSEALVSWYQNVYKPIINIIKKEGLLFNFLGYSESDLYVWIVKHWDYLKKKYGMYPLSGAAKDFSQKYGRNRKKMKYLWAFVKERFIYYLGHFFSKAG
jgi:hypothetical protein